MYNKFMSDKEINVKVGDRVYVHNGDYGTVTEVFHGHKTEWNGKEYVKIPGTDYTNVRVMFDANTELAKYGQYQNGVYGGFTVI